MKIGLGALGDVVFISSFRTPIKVRTFRDFQRDSSARWGTNEIHLQKPRSQFMGPGLDTISFTMQFDARLGMNPRKEAEKLLDYQREGKVLLLQIGGKPLGQGKWKIMNLSQSWEDIDREGNLLKAGLSVTLEEYV
ncbi:MULTISPECIES: phage tail protein [Paenibacillus]|uniref:phage tail protein n=1 Tax=Paenibacillus TaxID=44249 RepID=UPI0011A3B4C5|nr:phage tail protein [Paenibacillus sp. IHBB 10380]